MDEKSAQRLDQGSAALNRSTAGQKLRILFGGALALLLSSCMHAGMMGTGDGHHSDASHETMSESILEKEVIVGDIKAIATFPPLQMDAEVVVSVRLVNAKTAKPISGAKVYFHAVYLHTPEATASHNHGSGTRQPKGDHEINIDEEVKESSEAGVYAIPYGSSPRGEHTLMFHIAEVDDKKFSPEIVIEATRKSSPESHEQSNGMMGINGTAAYVVFGAVVTTVAMLAVLAAQGHMF